MTAASGDRPNQLHCRQPAVPTRIVDTIVKIINLSITVVSYQETVDLRAHGSTRQLYTEFGVGQATGDQ